MSADRMADSRQKLQTILTFVVQHVGLLFLFTRVYLARCEVRGGVSD